MVNLKLLAARKERRWSIEVASAQVGVSRITYSRWENGHQEPQPTALQWLCETFEKSAEDLGYGHLSKKSVRAEGTTRRTWNTNQNFSLFTENQLAAFTMLMQLGETTMFDPQKRATLQTVLAIVSMVLVKPQELLQPEFGQHLVFPEMDAVKLNEATLQGFEKLIEACWQLCRGNELAFAEKLLHSCLTKLLPFAQQPSNYQQTAANLAAQGFRLNAILAFHRNDLLTTELYDKQAVQYSLLSGDQNLLLASLKGLANTYRYREQYPQALQTYLDALHHTKEASPLLQACIYMGLAVAYAHIDQRQDSCNYLSQALDTFPDHPETDPGFPFADFDHAHMILWEGLTRSTLGQTDKALDTYKRIAQPTIIISERVRIEIFNQQAKTAIVAGDVEQGVSYVASGVKGAKLLGSQRRYNEAYENFKRMCILWPQEKQIKGLAELFYS